MKSYIYGLFENGNQVDQTSIDEMNENLAHEIMIDESGRTDCKHFRVAFIREADD